MCVEMSVYNFKRFDPSTIRDDKVIAITARRGSGKTTLMTDLLYHKRHIPAGIVMSATEEGNSHYGKFIPSRFIYNNYSDDVIQKLIARQKKLLGDKEKDVNVFLILDDIAFDKSIFRKESMRYMFMNGRHLKILMILSMQFSLDLPPALRSNVDYLICFADNNQTNQKRLYDHFFGNFPTFQSFQMAFQSLTKDYSCMILDNTVTSGKLEDSVFWYKAEFHRPFRIGADAYWKCQAKSSNGDEHSDEEEDHHSKSSKSKKRGDGGEKSKSSHRSRR